jgi:hypothetical protein
MLSSLIIVIPMVVFPAKLGLDLSSGSYTYALFEMAYYAFILFMFRPGSSLLQLLQGAGLTFLYRIILGSVFGVLISAIYGVNFTAALTLGVSRYMPAVILHVILAPFIVKPFYLSILGEIIGDRPRRMGSRTATGLKGSTTTRPQRAVESGAVVMDTTGPSVSTSPSSTIAEKGTNGFERAARYLGEHHAVRLAAVIDKEGLVMGNFVRGEINPEDWAPLALQIAEANAAVLTRHYDTPEPLRVDLVLKNEKLFIVSVLEFSLLVLANREDEDLLGIRLAQATEIISKYVSERYSRPLPVSPEEKYVSST